MSSNRSRLLVAGAAVISVLLTGCGTSQNTGQTQLKIGVVTNNPNGLRNVAGFIEGMEEFGYIDGETVSYIFAGEPVTGEDLADALAAMVSADVDLIFTAGTPTGVAAYHATQGTDIPVVFGVIADPVRAGVLEDLTTPGGNMTGVKTNPDQGRRLEQLLEIAPGISTVFVPYNPDDAASAGAVEQITALAPSLGIELVFGPAHDEREAIAVIDSLPAEVDAIFLVPDSVVNAHLEKILTVASDRRLPTSGPSTAQVEEGALTAFGFIHREAGVQAARIADKVLKGADPGRLPVETTESFLAINLGTADAIGLAITETILRQAAIIVRADNT